MDFTKDQIQFAYAVASRFFVEKRARFPKVCSSVSDVRVPAPPSLQVLHFAKYGIYFHKCRLGIQ